MNSKDLEDVADTFLKVQDISQKAGLPTHIRYLMSLKGDQDFISIHEWAARLCHALIVETGFFPVFDGALDLSPTEALEMSDEVRIPRYVRKLTPDQMFSERGVYILKYCAVLAELVNIPSSESAIVPEENVSSMEVDKSLSTTEPSNAQENEEMQQEWRYRFSKDINVTMLIMEDRLLVTGSYNPGEGLRSITHQLTINIEEFLTVRVRMVPLRLRADQWIKKFDLNSTRLAGFFKNKFAMYFLDQIDGLVFERRGLICLPDLVLMKILKMLNVKSVLNLGRTCVQLYDLVREDGLWQYLLKRDFKSYDVQPGPSIYTSSSPNSTSESGKKNFYEIYKAKHIARHRGIHRLNSFPIRFHPDLPRARRFPIHPFPSVRF